MKIFKGQKVGPNYLGETRPDCQMNLVRRVDLIRPVGTEADKVGEGRHQKGEALGVGEVPVEHVLLRVTHAVDQLEVELNILNFLFWYDSHFAWFYDS